jgi:hypothetical protein
MVAITCIAVAVTLLVYPAVKDRLKKKTVVKAPAKKPPVRKSRKRKESPCE